MKVKLYLCGGEEPISKNALGLGYLKTNCSDGHDIKIAYDPKELVGCDLIGLSANAWGIAEAVEILNSTSIPIVLGGQGTLWHGIEKYGFKHIVRGEGERAFKDILDEKVNEKILHPPLIEDMDSLKYPDRGHCRKKAIPILTSRGCPFHCSFCSTQNYWQKARFHSAQYFIDEVLFLMRTYSHMRTLYILDDLFIAHKKRFREIHEMWMIHGLHKRLRVKGFVRSDILDYETARMMKEMGFWRIRFGAESGSNRVLKLLNKGTTVEKHERAIEIAKSLNMGVGASFMFGIPGETEEDQKLTAAFIKKWEGILEIEGNYQFKAFPGTVFWEEQDLTKMDMRVREVKK